MARWLEYLPKRGGFVERFDHGYPLRAGNVTGRTLEIGAGLGAHLGYEKLNGQEYYAVELLQELADSIEARLPSVTTIVGDCQTRLPFDDAFFDRVLAVHVLEHLPNLRRHSRRSHACSRPTLASSPSLPCEGGRALQSRTALHLEASVRARVPSRLRLVHPLRAHQPALGDQKRAREAVPRR